VQEVLVARLSRDWRALVPEQRVAGVAAVGLFVTMLLPWYQQNLGATVGPPHHETLQLQSRNLNAFQVFSFIEAAVLLVALAVGYLLYARAEGHDFRLPGSDGTMVFIAGLWALALLVLRLFDKPGISGSATVGVQWGIFFAIAAAGALAYAGSRMRAEQRHPGGHHVLGRHHGGPHARGETERARRERPEPEPPTPAPLGSPASRPATAAGAGRSAPVPAERRVAPEPSEHPTAPVGGERPAGRTKPRYPPAPSGQMSFDDPPRRN
jgi:hypothetical protein